MSEPSSPRRVLVTGAFGMLGFHVRAHLHVLEGVETVCAGRAECADPDQLTRLVADVDAVLHLAGVNRGTDEEVEQGNLQAAQALIAALRKVGHAPTVLYASSTHRERETPYGRSKRAAGALLAEWAVFWLRPRLQARGGLSELMISLIFVHEIVHPKSCRKIM